MHIEHESYLALEHELSQIQSTVASFSSPREALRALIDWHVTVATDPLVNGGQVLRPDAYVRILKYQGKSGGFAREMTTRWSVFIVSGAQEISLDAWVCGNYGYNTKMDALNTARPFIDLFHLPVRYEEEVVTTSETRTIRPL